MFRDQSEIEALGAEGLPGGFAEMQRILQLARQPVVADQGIVEHGDIAAFLAGRAICLDIA